jgi:hypothetical protein
MTEGEHTVLVSASDESQALAVLVLDRAVGAAERTPDGIRVTLRPAGIRRSRHARRPAPAGGGRVRTSHPSVKGARPMTTTLSPLQSGRPCSRGESDPKSISLRRPVPGPTLKYCLEQASGRTQTGCDRLRPATTWLPRWWERCRVTNCCRIHRSTLPARSRATPHAKPAGRGSCKAGAGFRRIARAPRG